MPAAYGVPGMQAYAAAYGMQGCKPMPAAYGMPETRKSRVFTLRL